MMFQKSIDIYIIKYSYDGYIKAVNCYPVLVETGDAETYDSQDGYIKAVYWYPVLVEPGDDELVSCLRRARRYMENKT